MNADENNGYRVAERLRMIRRVMNCCGICVLLTLSVAAQDTRFKTEAPLVLVPVTVLDRKGRFVDGLGSDDFVLTDEGARQKIRVDTSDAVLAPVSVVVAVQSSSISSAALAKINKVGGMI